MIIILSGKGASGKTTVARMLAKRLKLRHYSTGDLMRELATTKGISLLKLNKIAEDDPSIDNWLDTRQEALGKQEDNFIIDSRLGFKFIPHSIKIMLEIDDKEAAKRIFHAPPRRGEESYRTINEALVALHARQQSEIKRIKKYYGINPYEKHHYDLIIDTTRKTPEQVCTTVITFLKKKKFYK